MTKHNKRTSVTYLFPRFSSSKVKTPKYPWKPPIQIKLVTCGCALQVTIINVTTYKYLKKYLNTPKSQSI